VCKRNLDLYTGTTGVYHHRHGNLRRDGVETVFARTCLRACSDEAIYLSSGGASSSTLASRRGDKRGTRVYFEHRSLRYRWLDRARRR
jgi:hypothetical protein